MKVELSNPYLDTTQSLAIDPSQFEQITANMTQEQGLQQAAQQFEAIFLQLVLKNMHAATEAMSSGNGFFASNEQKQFRDMHDAQMAQQLAAKNQLGLAEAIVRQFDEQFTPVENKFKEMAEVVADQHIEAGPEVTHQANYDAYNGPAFQQPLNIIPIR